MSIQVIMMILVGIALVIGQITIPSNYDNPEE